MGKTRAISSGLKRLVVQLNEQFGLNIAPYLDNEEHLASIYEHYADQRNHMKLYLGESNVFQSPNYRKAYLISEAARLRLREIAPKRLRKRKSKK